MERENERLDIVELGTVSADTRGDDGPPIEGGGFLPVTGLSDD